MKLAIMFCNIPQIEIYNIPDSVDGDVEEYILEQLGIDPDEVSWQCYDNDNEINVVLK